MAGKKPYLTSNDLIASVKRDISIPLTQVTYTEDDVLSFANEELFLGQVPSILEHHEEYLVYSKSVPLVSDQSRYDVPDRAIGMKLRDLFYVDDQNNMTPMVDVGASNEDFYNFSNSGYNTPRFFIMEGDEIILVPKMNGAAPIGSLLMKFYLRPNSLVVNDRAAISTNFLKQVTINNTNVNSGDKLVIDGIELVAGTDFTIGASNTATAANISTAINNLGNDDFSATASDAVVSIMFYIRDFSISTTDATAMIIDTKLGVQCEEIPEHFTDGMLVDFLQTGGGHKTFTYDVRIPRTGVSSNAIFFADASVPEKFTVGDYICEAGECIIPQIPSDLHMLLAQRTSSRILESQGDNEAAGLKNAKIDRLEAKQATLIDNRVEGSPKKIFNRNSLLRAGKRGRFRRF